MVQLVTEALEVEFLTERNYPNMIKKIICDITHKTMANIM